MEKSPEIVSTLDIAVGEGMHNINVQVTGFLAITVRGVHSSRTEPKIPSRQLNYYYRKTINREKRKYVPYSEQENPSWHLRRYYTKKTAADLSNTRFEANADDGNGYADIWPDDSGCTDHPTSDLEEGNFMYISEEPLDLCPTESEASISESEDEEFWSSSEDEDMDCSSIPDEPAQTAENLSGVCEQNDEPLYEGSSVSKILAYVLVVSFVLKHNLSKVAWQDLLRVIAVLLGNRCGEVMKSVYKMKLFLKNYFGTVEVTAVRYCASCLNLLNHGDCKTPHCLGKGVNTFLDLHPEKKKGIF